LGPVEDTSLRVCVASQLGQHFSWAGGIFYLNQHLLQPVPAVLQKRSLVQTDITGGIDMEWSIWGGELTWVNGPPLFLLKLDGASWTAGQGRGAWGCGGVLVGGYDLYFFPL